MVTSTAGVAVYVKGCSDKCNDEREILFGPTKITYHCCSNDLCNSSTRILNFNLISLISIVSLILLANSKFLLWKIPN